MNGWSITSKNSTTSAVVFRTPWGVNEVPKGYKACEKRGKEKDVRTFVKVCPCDERDLRKVARCDEP